jgi:misacylated tRNA(Ala) deacylase
MTQLLYREDPYLATCEARVVGTRGNAVVLDRTICYARGGGQPGDSGSLLRGDGGVLAIADTLHGDGGEILHVVGDDGPLPAAGEPVRIDLDWPRRHAHMRMHSCLHLLGAVLRYGVTGGNITAERSRLDFDMDASPDREAVEAELNALVERDLPVRAFWIDEAELDSRPELVRTLSVRPPRGAGRIRLLEIPEVDLQPCGGTHVARTGEIGAVRIGKIEKKGRRNRRVYVGFAAGS